MNWVGPLNAVGWWEDTGRSRWAGTSQLHSIFGLNALLYWPATYELDIVPMRAGVRV